MKNIETQSATGKKMLRMVLSDGTERPVRWLVSRLIWAGWCWFVVRGKHCWLADLGWLKLTSEQAGREK